MTVARGAGRPGAALLTLLLVACVSRPPDTNPLPPGTYRAVLETREADFRRRSYRLHVPPRLTAPAALVLVLHGAFSSAREIENRSGFSRIADREGFVAVYPSGYGFLGWFRHWNAGHCCGRARSLGLDDVGFLDRVLVDVAQRVAIDVTRVYVVGESNGAMLAYLYAAERSSEVAAVGVAYGTIGSQPAGASEFLRIPPPVLPVPLAILHGTADTSIPFDGGPPHGEKTPLWMSVPESAAFWISHNGITSEPRAETSHEGLVVRTEWSDGEGTAPVVLYELRGWPHTWPSPRSSACTPGREPLCQKFDGAEVIWRHLEPHLRTRPTERTGPPR